MRRFRTEPSSRISSFLPSAAGLLGNLFSRGGARKAFTLIELLVVIALIGILIGVIGFGFKSGTAGASLNNAERGVIGMIDAAKATAVLYQVRSRLIIYSDTNQATNDPSFVNSHHLRFYGVIYANSDDPTDPADYTTWTAANNGAMLPEDIYFVPGVATANILNPPPVTNNPLTAQTYVPAVGGVDDHPQVVTGTMQIGFPYRQSVEGAQGTDTYYFIEFAPDNFFRDPIHGNQANLVLGVATQVNDSTIDFKYTTNAQFTGVQLRQLGSTAPFRSILDIPGFPPQTQSQ